MIFLRSILTVDDQLYDHVIDDNQKVEPYFFAPIIPMVLVNGSAGIGTGWSTNIPNHNPRELAKNVLRMIDGQVNFFGIAVYTAGFQTNDRKIGVF